MAGISYVEKEQASPEVRAIYAEDLTRKVHTEPQVLERLKQFLTEKELVELAVTVGIANLANRFTESFQLTPP